MNERAPLGTYRLLEPDRATQRPSPDCRSCSTGSPFAIVECRCGQLIHVHQPAAAEIPTLKIGLACQRCSNVIVLDARVLAGVYLRLRSTA